MAKLGMEKGRRGDGGWGFPEEEPLLETLLDGALG